MLPPMHDLGGGFGADNTVDSCEGGVEGQSLLANEVLLVAASNDAGGWLCEAGFRWQMMVAAKTQEAGVRRRWGG